MRECRRGIRPFSPPATLRGRRRADAVTDGKHLADFADLGFGAEVLDLALEIGEISAGLISMSLLPSFVRSFCPSGLATVRTQMSQFQFSSC